jgi:hypothetical protein
VSRIASWIGGWLPSNYGVSDFLHNAILIRVPYRKGAVWKWYTYWGSLILEKTSMRFKPPRTVAAEWMSRGSPEESTLDNAGHVHLGFWALWASHEGFAGYDEWGNLPEDEKAKIILQVRTAIVHAGTEDIDVYVVGHSLGGAVSW